VWRYVYFLILGLILLTIYLILSGSWPPSHNGPTPRKRSSPAEYTNPERCAIIDMEECDRFCKLPSITVRSIRIIPMKETRKSYINIYSANDNAMRLSKKTIQPKDVLDAIHDLEFDSFLPRLESELTSKSSYHFFIKKYLKAN
jgi:hypothetical protein